MNNDKIVYIDIDDVIKLVEDGRITLNMGDGLLHIDMSNYEKKKIKIID